MLCLNKEQSFTLILMKILPKSMDTEVFDFKNAKNLNPEEVYKQFYHFDYAIRKLLPAIYKVYEITDTDLDKDF